MHYPGATRFASGNSGQELLTKVEPHRVFMLKYALPSRVTLVQTSDSADQSPLLARLFIAAR